MTGGFRFSLEGPVGSSYTVLASTNLQHWERLTNFIALTRPVECRDPAATNYHHRFYRVATP